MGITASDADGSAFCGWGDEFALDGGYYRFRIGRKTRTYR
jgi:hypothetical protein